MTRNWHTVRRAESLIAAGNSAWDLLSRDIHPSAATIREPILTAPLGGRVLAQLLARLAANDL